MFMILVHIRQGLSGNIESLATLNTGSGMAQQLVTISSAQPCQAELIVALPVNLKRLHVALTRWSQEGLKRY